MSTPGETRLDVLIENLRPSIDRQPFVFVSLDDSDAARLVHDAVALVRETEGTTLVLPLDVGLSEGLVSDSHFARIKLCVQSSLAAVGMTAVVSSALADAGIGANMLAGHFHDYVFVPWKRRSEAMAVLTELSAKSHRSIGRLPRQRGLD